MDNHLDVYTKKYLNVKKHIKFYMQNSWAVRHQSDDWGQSHIHANSLLSGVYYIQTKKNSGDICFHKPMGYTNIFHSSTNVPFEKFDNHNCDKILTIQVTDYLFSPTIYCRLSFDLISF